MISDAEEIRDNHLRAIFGNWSFQKNFSNKKEEYAKREIAEIGYIMGKRESRRLLGDIIITQAPPFLVPYRSLYSRNIKNLFMAGRHISTTHVAHAATRVQGYTGTYGEVVGIAAWLCKKLNVDPRSLYEYHLSELTEAFSAGVPPVKR